METLQDTSTYSSRPLGQHRLSLSSTSSSSFPKTYNRIFSHSNTTSSLISSHRVTRRKSVSTNSNAAMVAAVREAAAVNSTQSIPIVGHRATTSRTITTSPSARSFISGSVSSPQKALQDHKTRLKHMGRLDRGESAIDDDQMEYISGVDGDEGEEDQRQPSNPIPVRRASEGQAQLMKDGKKSNPSDLKCEKCGKGYKHSSCLSKHLFVSTFLLLSSLLLF